MKRILALSMVLTSSLFTMQKEEDTGLRQIIINFFDYPDRITSFMQEQPNHKDTALINRFIDLKIQLFNSFKDYPDNHNFSLKEKFIYAMRTFYNKDLHHGAIASVIPEFKYGQPICYHDPTDPDKFGYLYRDPIYSDRLEYLNDYLNLIVMMRINSYLFPHFTMLFEQEKIIVRDIILNRFTSKMPINYINKHPEDSDCMRMNRYVDFITSEVECLTYEKRQTKYLSLQQKLAIIENKPHYYPGVIYFIDTGKKLVTRNVPPDTQEQLETYIKDLIKRLKNPGHPFIKK